MCMYALLGANKGCLAADAALGYCLLMGFGAARDADRGMRLIRESAAAFCAAGMCVVAVDDASVADGPACTLTASAQVCSWRCV